MVNQILEFVCDICGNKSTTTKYQKLLLPCKRKFAKTEFRNSIEEFDVCPTCKDKISDLFTNYVADITVSYKNNEQNIESKIKEKFLEENNK